jgi:hypothetical protein
MLHSLLLANEQTSNGLTPVWLTAVGISAGFILFLLFWLAVAGLSRIPGLNRLQESKRGRLVVGSVLTALIFIAGMWLSYRMGAFSTAQPLGGPGGVEAAGDPQTEAGYNLVLALVTFGVLAPLLGFGFIALASARRRSEVLRSAWDGPLYWMNWICGGAAAFVGLGLALWATGGLEIFTIVDNPPEFARSLASLSRTGSFARHFVIPVSQPGDTGAPVPVPFRGTEIRMLAVETDQPLNFAAEPITADLPYGRYYRNVMGKDNAWLTQYSADGEGPIPAGFVSHLHVLNLGDAPANVTVRWLTEPIIVQVIMIPQLAVAIALIYVFVMLLVALAPKISAVALATFKTEVAQPIFLILILFGGIFILASVFIPYFTFGEDIKMYQESGLTVIRVLGIFLAIWAASKSIAEEIEGRTALTVLSKPIGRVQFVFGKFLGIAGAVGLLLMLLGLWFTVWTSCKPIYDTVESAERIFDWRISFGYVVANIPALMLIFMECILFVSISVAISTRVGTLPNFLICFCIYVLGHLTASVIASKSAGSIEQVVFVGRLISIIFPVLDHFDASTAIMTSTVVPLNYLAWAGIYTLLYGAIMFLLSLVLFQDRDLA